jgi:hypothetical protein
MGAKPLADVYEKLKELRRQGEAASSQSNIWPQLRAMYDDVVRTEVPDRFADLIGEFDATEVAGRPRLATLLRNLEIKSLADRVFGDDEKAEVWLHRPNVSLSGQKPIDLLKDELGTAVVRELLERIDHGIFA